jgi:hypothetical protein
MTDVVIESARRAIQRVTEADMRSWRDSDFCGEARVTPAQ